MSSELTVTPDKELSIIEGVLVNGDLAELTPTQRVRYYQLKCRANQLDPYSRPFDYIRLNGKLTLYANKNCSDQLRRLLGISIKIISRETTPEGLHIVTAVASIQDGRVDEAVGAINIKGKGGDDLANALMKAETKAKRRVTLSIAGLGMTDESELHSIPKKNIQRVKVDFNTGEILEEEKSSNMKYLPATKMTLTQEFQLCAFENERQLGRELYNRLNQEEQKKLWNTITKQEQEWLKSIMKDKAEGS